MDAHFPKMGTRPLPFLLLAATLSLCTRISTAGVAIHVEGVDDELQNAVRTNLQLQQYADREISSSQAQRLFANAESEAAEALEPYGYYRPHIEAELKPGDESGKYDVFLRITPGEPVTVGEVRIEISGSARDVPLVRQAIEAFRPKVGERLEHGAYEGSKSTIVTALQASGYFDAKPLRHRVEVTAAANSATIDLAWDGGERYRFGEVRLPDTQFSPDFLQRYVPWKADEYYSADRMLELQQRWVDADYFSAVSVQPDLDHRANGTVPIDTLLIPAKRTIYRAGAYVSTDSGPGVRLGIDRRWINDLGHKVGGEAEYSQRLHAISTYYRIPRPGERNRSYSFAAGYREEETDTSRSRMARISAAEILDRWHGYTRTLGLQYLNGDFIIADEQRHSGLLFAEGMLTRKRADNLLFPEHGISVTYALRLAVEGMLSDASLTQVQADAKWVRPAGKKSRLILRGSLGAMAVSDFDALPPELRFFAGGDRSVRGFDYQQIGEKNAAGGVIGGKYLTVVSTEYEHYFLEKWGAAVFVDAGDAYTSGFNASVGAGLGLRWRSPVGIVRLDLAVPVRSDDDENGLRVHILIGPDL
jgi:translocation and assembly module TamA